MTDANSHWPDTLERVRKTLASWAKEAPEDAPEAKPGIDIPPPPRDTDAGDK